MALCLCNQNGRIADFPFMQLRMLGFSYKVEQLAYAKLAPCVARLLRLVSSPRR